MQIPGARPQTPVREHAGAVPRQLGGPPASRHSLQLAAAGGGGAGLPPGQCGRSHASQGLGHFRGVPGLACAGHGQSPESLPAAPRPGPGGIHQRSESGIQRKARNIPHALVGSGGWAAVCFHLSTCHPGHLAGYFGAHSEHGDAHGGHVVLLPCHAERMNK